MQCPTDASRLRPILYEGVTIHSCDHCGGEFLGSLELSHIINMRDERFPQELKDAVLEGRQPMFGVPFNERGRTLACAQCGTHMDVLNYAGDTSIFIDRCPCCGGVWLDREELEKLQVILEGWQDEAPAQVTTIAAELQETRRRHREALSVPFEQSRLAFVNAVITRLLDAA